RLVEIVLGRRIHTEGPAAHVSAVEIELENLVLGQARFKPHRKKGFLDLTLKCPFIVEEQVLRELLRDRGAALYDAASSGVCHQRARGTGKIDSEVLIETAVFGRQHRFDQMIGKLVEWNRIVVPNPPGADF